MINVVVKNVTIPLPVDEDIFLVDNKSGEIISTDTDLHLTLEEMEALGLTGIKETIDGIIYHQKPVDCIITGFYGKDEQLNGTIVVNNCSLTDMTANITLQTSGYIDSERINRIYDNLRIIYDSSHKEKYGLTPKRHTDRSNNKFIYTGYNLNNTEYATCPMPAIDINKIGSLYGIYSNAYLAPPNNSALYNDIANHKINIIPNELWLDGDIKMRRMSCRGDIAVDETQGERLASSYCCKGDYAGLKEDELLFNFDYIRKSEQSDYFEIKSEITQNFVTESATQSIKTYIAANHGGAYNVRITINNGKQCRFSGRMGSDVKIPTTGTLANMSFANAMGQGERNLWDNYFEIENLDGGILDCTITITYEYDNVYGRQSHLFDFQQHFIDRYSGIKRLLCTDEDATTITENLVYSNVLPNWSIGVHAELKTNHFDSRAWGAGYYADYDGHIDVSGFTAGNTDNWKYHEDEYMDISNMNNFTPLQYIEPIVCLSTTFRDLWTQLGYLYGYTTSFSDTSVTWYIPYTDYLPTFYEITEYLTSEKFVLNEEGATIKYGNKEIEIGNGGTLISNSHFLDCVLNTTNWHIYRDSAEEIGPYNILVDVELNDNGTLPQNALNKEDSNLLFNNMKRIFSGSAGVSTYYRNMYAAQISGNGYAIYTTPAGINIQRNLNTSIIQGSITQLPTYITVEVTIIGWIDRPYVRFQDNLYYVLGQEMNINGINRVTLLKYV